MTNLAKIAAFTAVVFNLGALAACESESDPASSEAQSSTAASSSSSNTSASSGSGGGEECGAGSVDQNDACEVCVATSCTAEALACCQVTGCLDIIACAQETGCDGINCYTPDNCQEEIDNAGGPTTATQYAIPLGDCAAEKCANECTLMGS